MQVFLFQENGNPDGVFYTEVNIGKDDKPRPKERNSIKKKVNLRNSFKKENVGKDCNFMIAETIQMLK